MIDLIISLLPGLPTSLSLTLGALLIAFLLALFLTIILSLKTAVFSSLIQGYITLFTGTPFAGSIFSNLLWTRPISRAKRVSCFMDTNFYSMDLCLAGIST